MTAAPKTVEVVLRETEVIGGVKHRPGDRVTVPADHYLAKVLKPAAKPKAAPAKKDD